MTVAEDLCKTDYWYNPTNQIFHVTRINIFNYLQLT